MGSEHKLLTSFFPHVRSAASSTTAMASISIRASEEYLFETHTSLLVVLYRVTITGIVADIVFPSVSGNQEPLGYPVLPLNAFTLSSRHVHIGNDKAFNAAIQPIRVRAARA